MTNTQKTHYCPECERLAKENERLREALKHIADELDSIRAGQVARNALRKEAT